MLFMHSCSFTCNHVHLGLQSFWRWTTDSLPKAANGRETKEWDIFPLPTLSFPFVLLLTCISMMPNMEVVTMFMGVFIPHTAVNFLLIAVPELKVLHLLWFSLDVHKLLRSESCFWKLMNYPDSCMGTSITDWILVFELCFLILLGSSL